MKESLPITVLLSVLLSSLVLGALYILVGFHSVLLVKIFILLFIINFIVVGLVVELLYHRQLRALMKVFKQLKQQRIDKLQVSSDIYRLPIFKKMFRRAFRHFYRVEKKIDELTKLAAFRKEFIADVSHELKTPIFAAQGFVHTLLDGADQDEKVRTKFLEKAAKSLDGLDLLVHDLLTLSHIEIGETKMHFEYFDLRGLITEVVEQFEKRAVDKKIILTIDNWPNPKIVYADWLRIKQVLNNLISNAIKYTNEGGSVSILLEQEKEEVYVMIKDTGEGIPKHDLNRIFERFYRVDKSRSREKGGTGLGLAIVKHILEGHDSKVEVESEVGRGTTFRFSLPRGKE